MGEGVSYDLQVGRDKKFRDLAIEQFGLQQPLFNFADSLEYGFYYVRIRGVLGDGQVSPWTPYQILKIKPKPFGWIETGMILTFLAVIII